MLFIKFNSNKRITVDTYGHLVPGGNREAVDRLDDTPASATISTLNKKNSASFG